VEDVSKNRIRLLIVDDNALLRSVLIQDFDLRDDFEVIGEAEDGQQAIDLAERLSPDVILMDLVMPSVNGAEATAAIHQRHPNIVIFILTSGTEPKLIDQALQAGAKGYLTKSVQVDKIVENIRKLYKERR
jgi:DNA-binding NarL/FixJ family response regulator